MLVDRAKQVTMTVLMKVERAKQSIGAELMQALGNQRRIIGEVVRRVLAARGGNLNDDAPETTIDVAVRTVDAAVEQRIGAEKAARVVTRTRVKVIVLEEEVLEEEVIVLMSVVGPGRDSNVAVDRFLFSNKK